MKQAKAGNKSLGAAFALGLLAAFGTAIVMFIILALPPTSPVHSYMDMVIGSQQNNTPTDLSSPLAYHFMDLISRQDALLGSPISLFVGGLVFGRLAGRRYSQKKVYLTSFGMAVLVIALALAPAWFRQLYIQNGHIAPHQFSPIYLETQSLFCLYWTAMCVVGTGIGAWWSKTR